MRRQQALCEALMNPFCLFGFNEPKAHRPPHCSCRREGKTMRSLGLGAGAALRETTDFLPLPCPPSSAHSRCMCAPPVRQEGLCRAKEEGGDLLLGPGVGYFPSLFPILKAKSIHCSNSCQNKTKEKEDSMQPRETESEKDGSGTLRLFQPIDCSHRGRSQTKPYRHCGADPDLALGSPRSSSHHLGAIRNQAHFPQAPRHSTFPHLCPDAHK